MNRFSGTQLKRTAACLAGLLGFFAGVAVAAPANPQPVSKQAPAPKAIVEADVPESVFNAPQNAAEGRNPFFPNSTTGFTTIARPTTNLVTKTQEISGLNLNGITPMGPKRTAMINFKTFERGEEGEIKLSNGARILIKCLEIRNDSVLIGIGAERRELSLRKGL